MRIAWPPGASLPTAATIALLTAGLTLALFAVVFELWHASPGVPLAYGPGPVVHQAMVKALGEGGATHLAAPGGQDLTGFRLDGERLDLGVMLTLGWLTGDAAVAANAFILLSFVATALAALFASRALGLSWVTAAAVGVLFAFLPMHVSQVLERPLVAGLWGVSIAGYLAVVTIRGRVFFRRVRGSSTWWADVWLPLALAALVALSGWLVGLLAAATIFFAAVIGAVGRGRRVLISGFLLSVAVAVVVAINLGPSLVRSGAGQGGGIAGERPNEITSSARVDLAELVLPIRGHRIPPLAAAREAHTARHPHADGGSALGIVGAAGLAVLAVGVFASLGRPSRLGALMPDAKLGVLALGLLLVFGAGGLLQATSSVFPSLDRWTPVGAFIGFLALLAAGELADRGLAWVAARGFRPVVVAAGAALAVVVVGVADQTSGASVPDHAGIGQAYARDAAFVRRLEERLPTGGMVFQLPVVPIPQATAVEGLQPYDQLKPYLHADELQWSGGAIAGTAALWQDRLGGAPVRMLPPTLAALGFDAILVHRDAYGDGGDSIEATLAALIGEESATGLDDRFAVFDLTRYRGGLERAHSPEVLDRLAVSAIAPGQLAIEPFMARLELVADGLTQPVGIVEVPGGSGQLAVVERAGLIRIVDGSGRDRSRPLLDISDLVATEGWEQGLLGLAFHPRHAENGRLFVHYTDLRDDVVVAEFRLTNGASEVDRETVIEVTRLPKAGPFHNGGQLEFGPDGYLYASFGDGVIDFPSSGHVGTGQDRSTLFGSIIRIDVDVDAESGEPYVVPSDNPFVGRAGRSEIWVNGLRNPWRFSFDSATGDLFIGDVGQLAAEEVNVQPAGSGGGENYGWREMAGASCFEDTCDPADFALPLHEYPHDAGRCAVTGGYVYRGTASASMEGLYLLADLCSGQIWSIDPEAASPVAVERLDTDLTISTFGRRQNGELLVADYSGGAIYDLRMEP